MQPWLGARMAVAVVPAEEAEAGVVPVAALAVTDDERMTEALTRAQQGADFGFALRDDYVLITDTQERAESIAAAEETLADDADFAGDRDALGGDQIALAWADLSAAQGVLERRRAGCRRACSAAQELSGRVILGVHAEDDAVEMVGLDFGVSDFGVPTQRADAPGAGPPRDTLAALSVVRGRRRRGGGLGGAGAVRCPRAGRGAALRSSASNCPRTCARSSARTSPWRSSAIVGNPAFGARVTTEQPQEAVRLLDAFLARPSSPSPSSTRTRTAVTSSPATQATARRPGRRRRSRRTLPAFRAAVADPDDASAIGYVNLAAVVDQLVAQGGDHGEEAAKFSAVEALGFSATGTDEGSRFVLRITTR